jgi:tRNA U38,U39,U40 pseudouridine synthase TruA
MVMIKEQVAFLFGYEDLSNASVQTDSGTTVVEQSSKIIQETLLEALQTRLDVPQTVRDEISLSTFTQSSLARLRRRALSQEAGCSAAGDVLVVSVNVPKTMTRKNWKQIFQVMKSRLATLHDQDNNETKVHLYACQLMDNTGAAARFHAERSCTQRVYHYVLPVAWLPEGDKLQEWWQQPDSSSKATSMKRPESNIHSSNFPKKASPPPRSLKKLKDALRSAESAAIPLKKTRCNQNANDDSANFDLQLIKVANGRYGALGCKERRPWHSFASQELAGGAVSPNHETAWRVVDKARIIGFVEDEANDDNNKDDSGGTQKPTQISAIVEVKGDEFLPEQIRRIIGSAVAIAHGWLPDDFFSLSLSSDTVVETPLAPAGRLYLSETRFHFEELKANGLPLFRDHRSRRIVQEWNTSEALEMSNRLQQMILKKKQSTDEMVIESNWFEDLRGITCPRICESFENEVTLAAIATPTSMRVEDVDKAFAPVLSELRRIVAGGEWPETSAARSSVIRGDSDRDGTDGHKMGSFTIVNPLVLSGNEIRAVANAKFPVLVEEVFRLETVLSERQMTRVTLQGLEQNLDVDRPASSHCAVNCNAQFKPHVDSGVGMLL